ncbi:hypothetical protein DPMN_121833 [Dreissena polymorpha]|uniref:Uncharacterized protein n=1 Tax=Dreissena polymorpha TaxID=45954 RepID=A0A9D4GMV1_DREPO|nr:hypothetical protein DPMN_121833 [Dreissena polymorpha]
MRKWVLCHKPQDKLQLSLRIGAVLTGTTLSAYETLQHDFKADRVDPVKTV